MYPVFYLFKGDYNLRKSIHTVWASPPVLACSREASFPPQFAVQGLRLRDNKWTVVASTSMAPRVGTQAVTLLDEV